MRQIMLTMNVVVSFEILERIVLVIPMRNQIPSGMELWSVFVHDRLNDGFSIRLRNGRGPSARGEQKWQRNSQNVNGFHGQRINEP